MSQPLKSRFGGNQNVSNTQSVEILEPVEDLVDVLANSNNNVTPEKSEKDLTVDKDNTEIQVEAQPQDSVEEDKSSFNNETPPENVESSSQNEVNLEVTDDLILKHLSERLGRDVKSFEDFLQKPTENDVDIDPQIKALNEWKLKTGRPIEDYFKYNRDLTKLSDLEIAKEFLRIEYPNFDESDIELELQNFLENDDDLEYDIAKKRLELKKYATKGRKELEKLKLDLGEPSLVSLPPDVKQKIDFADQVQKQIEDNKSLQKDYSDNILKSVRDLVSMPLKLSDSLNIDFRIPVEDKGKIPQFINDMPHWRNEDGSWNHKAVVEDSVKIKYFDNILKIAFEQGLNSGKDEVIRQAKNTTLGETTTNLGQQNEGNKKPKYENLGGLLNKKGISSRFGK